MEGAFDACGGVGELVGFVFAVEAEEHGAHVVEFAVDELGGEGEALLLVVVSTHLGEAELAVAGEDGGEVAGVAAVGVEEGDFDSFVHEGGDGGGGEGGVALDDDAVYFEEGDADFLFGLVFLFVGRDVDDEGVAVFFDEGVGFGEVEGGHDVEIRIMNYELRKGCPVDKGLLVFRNPFFAFSPVGNCRVRSYELRIMKYEGGCLCFFIRPSSFWNYELRIRNYEGGYLFFVLRPSSFVLLIMLVKMARSWSVSSWRAVSFGAGIVSDSVRSSSQ